VSIVSHGFLRLTFFSTAFSRVYQVIVFPMVLTGVTGYHSMIVMIYQVSMLQYSLTVYNVHFLHGCHGFIRLSLHDCHDL
jgi:hypothetical protein